MILSMSDSVITKPACLLVQIPFSVPTIQEAAIIPAMALLTAPIAGQSQIVVHWKCGPRHGQGHSHGRGRRSTIKIQLVDSNDDDDPAVAAALAAAISDLSCKRIIQSAAAAANAGAKVGRPAQPTERASRAFLFYGIHSHF